MSRRSAAPASQAAAAAEFPGWRAWPSSAGRWWATRATRRKRPAGAPAEWAMTVDADTLDQLREVIAHQDQLAGSG
jgi:hypothetical protein